MSLSTIPKSHYIPCEHICGKGCSIYETKPAEYTIWECKSGWIDGDDRRRPDQLGVMFEFRIVGERTFLWAYEVWSGALDDPKVKHLLDRLSKSEIVVRYRYGSMQVDAPVAVLEFLKRNGCGTMDVPIIPYLPICDDAGVQVGYRQAEGIANEFKVTLSYGPFRGFGMIDMNYRLRPGDVLEFISPIGSKSLGNLLTAEDIMNQWNIDAQQYEELLLAGLPVIRFGAGDVRHSEVAVDEFFRQMASAATKPEAVGTPYIAERLGCTSIWITEMVRRGVIPPACVVPGTGDGKPWKFYRLRIDEWIRRR